MKKIYDLINTERMLIMLGLGFAFLVESGIFQGRFDNILFIAYGGFMIVFAIFGIIWLPTRIKEEKLPKLKKSKKLYYWMAMVLLPAIFVVGYVIYHLCISNNSVELAGNMMLGLALAFLTDLVIVASVMLFDSFKENLE